MVLICIIRLFGSNFKTCMSRIDSLFRRNQPPVSNTILGTDAFAEDNLASKIAQLEE